MRSRHGAVSGKRGKEKDEPAVCGEGSGDGDKRVKGFCSVKRRGGSGVFSLLERIGLGFSLCFIFF
jgi:hypothetical protein